MFRCPCEQWMVRQVEPKQPTEPWTTDCMTDTLDHLDMKIFSMFAYF